MSSASLAVGAPLFRPTRAILAPVSLAARSISAPSPLCSLQFTIIATSAPSSPAVAIGGRDDKSLTHGPSKSHLLPLQASPSLSLVSTCHFCSSSSLLLFFLPFFKRPDDDELNWIAWARYWR